MISADRAGGGRLGGRIAGADGWIPCRKTARSVVLAPIDPVAMPPVERSPEDPSRFDPFPRRTLTAVGIAAAVAVLILLFHRVVGVLLLVFAGVLLAVLLHGLAKRASGHTPLSHGWALLLVILVLL